MLSTMCEEAHISDHKQIIPFKLLQECNSFIVEFQRRLFRIAVVNHHNIEGLRQYKCISDEQNQEVCRTLANEKILPMCVK